MTHEQIKKERILAIVTVAVLFLVVGILFIYISFNNWQNTQILRNKVIQQRIAENNKQELQRVILISTSTPTIFSKSFLTLAMTNTGGQKILNQKEPDLVLPIASITKLMVGIITIENIKLDTKVKATLDYIGKEESTFIVETNKTYTVRELLANVLVSSDNDSARLLASVLGENNFIAKMNRKAQALGLTKTNFVNITGLDPKDSALGANVSTATDLANLLIYINNERPEILELTTKSQYNFCDINNFCKTIINTNKLLNDKDIQYKIMGGKTGSTDLALKNLVLITGLTDNLSLISIVLGSVDNFRDTKALINQVEVKN